MKKKLLIAELYMNDLRCCHKILVRDKFPPSIIVPFVNPYKPKWYSKNEPMPIPTPEQRRKEFQKHLMQLVFKEQVMIPLELKTRIIQKYALVEIRPAEKGE